MYSINGKQRIQKLCFINESFEKKTLNVGMSCNDSGIRNKDDIPLGRLLRFDIRLYPVLLNLDIDGVLECKGFCIICMLFG